ncbi:DNRLRE domain-containing protein [bacterium]|nr:DNRLRE domain-containing protein [bacterium]
MRFGLNENDISAISSTCFSLAAFCANARSNVATRAVSTGSEFMFICFITAFAANVSKIKTAITIKPICSFLDSCINFPFVFISMFSGILHIKFSLILQKCIFGHCISSAIMFKTPKTPLVYLILLFATTSVFAQTCDYTISPSTHHNWIDVTAQRITDSIGLGADSMILRTSKKITASSAPYNSKQYLVTRSFIKFDLAFDANNSCSWSNAYLNLKFTGNALDSHKTTSGANDFIIARITEDWGDDTLRWKTPPLIAPYRMPITSKRDEIKVSGTSIGDEDYKINIVSFINFWRQYPDSNFGIEIRLANETGTRSVNFASSEFTSPLARPSIDAKISSCGKNKAYAGKDVEICIGDEYQLNAQYLEFFEWSSTAPIDDKYIANPITKPTSPGTYTYTLKAVLGTCSSTDEMQITVHPYPKITVSADKDICYGDTVQITVTGATNYAWTPKAYIDDYRSAAPQVFPKTTTRYDVYADDGNQCKTVDSVKVIVRPLTKTDAGSDVNICEGDTAKLLVTGGKTYKWVGTTTGLSSTTIANPMAFPKKTTTYHVIASNGYCPIEDSVKVSVIPAFTVDAGSDMEICLGDTAFFNAEQGFFYYSWKPAGLFNKPNSASPMILDLNQTTTFTLRVEDENKCSATDQVKVTVNKPPYLYIGSDTFLCVTETLDVVIDSLSGKSPYKYSWDPTYAITTDPSARDITIEGIKDTLVLYTLTVEDANGCKIQDDILVTTLAGIEITTYGDTTICNGSAVEIGAKGGRFYKWYGEDILGSDLKRTALVKPDKPTAYRVEISNGEQCGDAVGFVNVNVVQLPQVYAHLASSQVENDTVWVCKGRYVNLEADGAESYVWSTEDSTNAIDYRVVADDIRLTVYGQSKGCKGPMDTILLKIDPTDTCYSKLWVPNAFTPNDDLRNDVFEIHPVLIRDFKMSIYNRWGELLFYTDDPYDWWDGTFNGKLVMEGAYYYVIEAFGKDEESRNLSGTVQVIY